MEIFQVRGVADIFETPELDPRNPSVFLATLDAADKDRLEQVGTDDAGRWIEVHNADFGFPHMWVRTADIIDADQSKPLPVDLFTFVSLCTIVTEDFNSRQAAGAVGVSRDYLLALSVVLNGLEKTDFTDAALASFDAFRFTDGEWGKFCADPALNVNERHSFDQLDPLAQIDAAVNLTFAALQSAANAADPPDPAAGPYVPNSIDLFLMHMLGRDAGLAILKDKVAGVALTKPWTDYVGAAGGDPTSLKARYPRFLNVPGNGSTADLSDMIESIFDDAYVVVSKVTSDAHPEEAPDTQGAPDISPTWMTVAGKEKDKGVERPDARILDYFKLTNFHGATVMTPWCGAFVSYCLGTTGVAVPDGSAAAATWTRWGRPVGSPHGRIPLGAVVVVSHTPDSDKAGHVAFFAGDGPDPRRILLLGGNQGAAHAVTQSSFPRSCVLAIRWPKDAVAPAGPGTGPAGPGPGPAGGGAPVGDIAIGSFTPDDWDKFCTVLGKRESDNDYSRVNPIGYCGRWQFGALALADGGYVRKGCPQGRLADSTFWTGKDGIRSRRDWCLNQQVQNTAMLAYTRGHYNQLKRLRVVDATSSKADLAGYLAAAHLVGVGGAEDLHNGVVRHDANGTTSREYFALLSNEFK